MPDFIPGIELAKSFYHEAVQPILHSDFSNLRYDAALIGSGSDVLHFDTPMSRDHFWGPRLMLFVSPADRAKYAEAITESLSHKLPYTFLGYSTHYAYKPPEPHIPIPEFIDSGKITHLVSVLNLHDYVLNYTGLDLAREMTALDWLTVSSQKLRTLVAGGVYHNGLGEVQQMRAQLAWYPEAVWRYLLLCGWQRIAQEEPFVGRTGDVGDDLGSRIIAARLVRDVMRLCFLMEREYPPYSKWYGTAFARLKCAPMLMPLLDAALHADTWQARESALAEAYQIAAEMHNALHLTEPLSTEIVPFFGRPYRVLFAGRYAEALRESITDSTVRQLAQDTLIGSIDQFSDSTDLLENAAVARRARGLYGSSNSDELLLVLNQNPPFG
jgi:hypothetical protein